jgi:bifunctional UDP-N-acetylglucosamine pyrophosphorylase/glucosamine-1-phosphate N-acetyltransferase
MRSSLPKVLHPLLGRPLAHYALEAARQATGAQPVMIVGHAAEAVRRCIGDAALYVVQEPQLGTGHAVGSAKSALQGQSDMILVTYADMPLLTAGTLQRLVEAQENQPGPLTMLTVDAGIKPGGVLF